MKICFSFSNHKKWSRTGDPLQKPHIHEKEKKQPVIYVLALKSI